MQRSGLTYRDAGVDIDAGDTLVRRIAPLARATARPGVMGGIGGFGGLFDLSATGFRDPVLVAATDGVGTKLKVGIESGLIDGLGQDLVAMCVNDLACQGAEPLFFLDYLATGHLDLDAAERLIAGIAAACGAVDCALIGGETAEMPGLYRPGEFDIAGFAVGAVERDAILPLPTRAGDVLIALPSSGLHANGFSLVRRVAEMAGAAWDDPAPFASGTLGDAVMAPTSLYVEAVRAARTAGGLRAVVHVTGGGLTGNVPRALAPGHGAEIDPGAWTRPAVFDWLQDAGGIAGDEMLRTFNCGVGLVLLVASDAAPGIAAALSGLGEAPVEIGRVVEGAGVRYSAAA
jgi:phosphoribosylformylglycinamidine cyclo-ligase